MCFLLKKNRIGKDPGAFFAQRSFFLKIDFHTVHSWFKGVKGNRVIGVNEHRISVMD